MRDPLNVTKVADFVINGSMGLYAVQSVTSEAKDWVSEHTQLPECYGREFFPVEGRYIEDLTLGMLLDGLSVEVNGQEAYIGDDDVVCSRA